jgi:hypothetical protein
VVAVLNPEKPSMATTSTRARQCCGRWASQLLPVTEGGDDGVIGFDEDLDVRTAPLGVASGAVVGVVTGCRSG